VTDSVTKLAATERTGTMRDDAEIVEAVRRGDVEAFRFLVERHQDRVHGVLRQLTNDPDRIEELAQEAFVRDEVLIY
jgi:RNA polymerase sigma-70 factor (ECF subfamily)